MRLTKKQLDAITSSFKQHFNDNDSLWLFGSRVDDTARGGDIDLYIETTYNAAQAFEKKIKFIVTIKRTIGEQKIDVVLNVLAKQEDQAIYQEQKNRGKNSMKKERFLSDYIQTADKHVKRLRQSLVEVEPMLPITPGKIEEASITQLACLDMLTTRFGKLQDLIGARIFPLILNKLGEDEHAFIDKLNRLEKLDYIESAEWWMDLREIRNNLAHDYPGNSEICDALNTFIPKSRELLTFWEQLQVKITKLS